MSHQHFAMQNPDLSSPQLGSMDFLETPALVAASFFVMALVLWLGPQGVVNGVEHVVSHVLALV